MARKERTGSEWSPRLRWELAPCYLLVIVAVMQLIMALGFGLNPWKGGGFGMFSTGKSRVVRASGFFLAENGSRAALRGTAGSEAESASSGVARKGDDGSTTEPAVTDEAAAKMFRRPLPISANAARQAGHFPSRSNIRWVLREARSSAAAVDAPLVRIRVEVWETTFVGDTASFRQERIQTFGSRGPADLTPQQGE